MIGSPFGAVGYRYPVRRARASVPVAVYGTRWCAASQQVRRLLDRLGVPYSYIDLEEDPRAASRLAWLTGGYVSHPTVAVGGEILVEPSIGELEWALRRAGTI